HFHFAETLATELRLSAQRLLGDERVGADRACVHLVVDEVPELQHVRDAHGYRLIEAFAREAIVQIRAAERRQSCFFQFLLYVFDGRAVEDRCGILAAEFVAGPSEHGFEDLSQVHPRGYTQRVETDIDRRSVFQEGHIFFAHDTCDDTLVPVTSRHLVADLQLALLGNIYLRELNDTRRQLVAYFESKALACEFTGIRVALDEVVLYHLGYQVIGMIVGSPVVERHVGDQVYFFRYIVIAFVPVDVLIGEQAGLNDLGGELHSLCNKLVVELVTDAIAGLSIQEDPEFLDQFVTELGELLAVTCLQRVEFLLRAGADILVALRPRVEFRVDNDALE